MKNIAKKTNQYHLHIQGCPCGFKLVMEGYRFPWERAGFKPKEGQKNG